MISSIALPGLYHDRKKRGITPHLPTLEEFLKIKSVDMQDDESKRLAVWYAEDWISMLCGPVSWGDPQKNFKMLVGKTLIGGESKVCVTITNEAFGYLMLANCRQKWINSFLFKEANPDKRIPQGNKADPGGLYKALYSDSGDGQVKGGGWKDKAYEKFNEYIDLVTEQRDEDRAEDWKNHGNLRDLIRTKRGITEKSPSKKRKRRKSEGGEKAAPPKRVKVIVLNE